jgi:CubicO group peptidase (beta-lactamase class C family)
MVLVDEGIISLEDKTSKYIDWWTKDKRDPRSHTTLRHHLSMTDGFGQWVDTKAYAAPFPVCWAQPENSAEMCVREAYDKAYGQYGRWIISPETCRDSRSFALSHPDVPFPGKVFYYEENHWDMTELMVEKATGQKFNAVANSKFFKPLGMEAAYVWPSVENPDLGGGVSTTARNYEKFLHAALNSQLLSASAWENIFKVHTDKAKEGYSIMECEGVESATTWGYGLGNWLHCKEPIPSACVGNKRHSSLGFGGFLPVVDRALGMYVVISQNDPTGNSQANALELQERLFAVLESHPKIDL